nr:tyrosine-type recombinase/integrase [Streptococcus ruminicola]
MSVIKLETFLEKKREAKFLEIHEIRAFFEALSRRRNPNYYDLAIIVLLFSGLRIGEAAFTKEDFDAESVFRTEYGSPITSHSFREVLARVETDLIKNCEERYGFKWTKHVTPHSFRHMHITYLQSEGMKVAIKEIIERVGHANYETTMLYTHSQGISENQTVKAFDKFIDRFEALKSWSSKYSKY